MNLKRRATFHSSFRIHHSSLRFLVRPVLAAAAAELPELQALRRRLLILRRHVVAALALGALQHDVVARHNLPLSIFDLRFLISDLSTRFWIVPGSQPQI